MKKFLLSTVALVALGASASAADLAPRYTKAPTMIDPAYNWTGFYVGLNAGAASTERNLAVVATGIGFSDLHDLADTSSKTGFLGGGQIGYNYQSGMSVFGVEADAAWLNLKSSTSSAGDPFFHGDGNAVFSSSIDWLVTARARAGTAATPALLLYVTGGLAVAGVNVKYQNNAGIAGDPFINSFSVNETKYGWTAGFGAEYALGGNWSVKAEYLRVQLGDSTLNVPLPDPGANLTGTVKVSQNVDLIRAGINYKFGGPAVARY
jgi:outer membrane immunogenic protein